MECINIKKDNECCGCRACENICPKKAIIMKENHEGFLYPFVDETKCVHCGLCKKVCPWINKINGDNFLDKPVTYAAKSLKKDIQIKSSSGGIFGTIAQHIILNGGVVVGCMMDSEHRFSQVLVNNIDDLEKLYGSKYVSSNMNDIYLNIKEYLNNNVEVLFSGVPCQISALKSFLRKDYQNLITVEVICHGVPSQKLFLKYVNYLEDKYNSELVDYKFRSKYAAKWGTFKALATFKKKNGKVFTKKINADFDPYYWNFLNSQNFRESCYECKFANKKRNADITLGDFWGIEKIMPDMVDYDGVSVIVANSQKGNELLQTLSNEIVLKNVEFNKVCENNGQLEHPSIRPSLRGLWYKKIDENDFIKNLYIGKNLRSYIKIFFPQKLKFIIKKLIKNK